MLMLAIVFDNIAELCALPSNSVLHFYRLKYRWKISFWLSSLSGRGTPVFCPHDFPRKRGVNLNVTACLQCCSSVLPSVRGCFHDVH